MPDTTPIMKLTLVSIYANGVRLSLFIKLPHYNGKAVLPYKTQNEILDRLGVRRGQTYSVGL